MADEDREAVFQRIAQVVDGIVAEACLRHYKADTQEHQFTAKIADALERELRGTLVNGYSIEVYVQDFPDKGRGSKERKSGADLYISIVFHAPEGTINKGMLVQSKWDDTMGRSKKELDTQSGKMLERSDSSYVWVYGPAGVLVVPAQKVSQGNFELQDTETVGELIANGLRCTEGDPNIGRSLQLPPVESLNVALNDIAADRGLTFILTEPA